MTTISSATGGQNVAPVPSAPRATATPAALGMNVQDLLRLTSRPPAATSQAGGTTAPQGNSSALGLGTGSSGDEVAQLQGKLRTLGYFNYPRDTGYFGEGTANAVAAFQQDQGLTPTGFADGDTLDAVDRAIAAQPPAPVSGPHSEIAVDTSVQPRSHSTIPGYENHVEQCGEFVYRYFHAEGKGYPTFGQPYNFLMTGRDANGVAKPQFERNFNGGTTPPQAGDILVAKGPKPGQFHTALITKVDGNKVTVLQANVPYNWQGGKELTGEFPLEFKDGKYTMPVLPTSQKGYRDDYPVIGWIHPTGKDALPQK